jgi:hypothetical protein
MPPTATPEPPTATPEPPTATATASLTPTPTVVAALVTAEAANVRDGPGAVYPIIGTLEGGASLVVLGRDDSGDWLQVRMADGQTAWLFKALTDFIGSAPSVEAPPPPTATPTPPIEGWRGEYYSGVDLSGFPVLVRDDPTIKFKWGLGAPSASLPIDEFSVRWTRAVYLPGGAYEFAVRSDDGVRVWMDGELIIDLWQNAAGTHSVEKSIDEDMHTFRVEYYEWTGEAEIEFWWDRAFDFAQWRGAYFSNVDLIGAPIVVRNDDAIDFDWGHAAPASGLPEDGFSVRWARTLAFTEGLYRFDALVDDGLRLFVDGYLVIDEWRDGGRREVKAERRLAAGNHSLRVEYYERVGRASVQVWWQKIYDYPEWRAEYWSNLTMEGLPKLVRNDRAIDFNWAKEPPSAGLPRDGFFVRWSRTVDFEKDTYHFHALADDGLRLFIDGELRLDEWHDSDGTKTYQFERKLDGRHQLVAEYYDRTGKAQVKLWWEPTSSIMLTPTVAAD